VQDTALMRRRRRRGAQPEPQAAGSKKHTLGAVRCGGGLLRLAGATAAGAAGAARRRDPRCRARSRASALGRCRRGGLVSRAAHLLKTAERYHSCPPGTQRADSHFAGAAAKRKLSSTGHGKLVPCSRVRVETPCMPEGTAFACQQSIEAAQRRGVVARTFLRPQPAEISRRRVPTHPCAAPGGCGSSGARPSLGTLLVGPTPDDSRQPAADGVMQTPQRGSTVRGLRAASRVLRAQHWASSAVPGTRLGRDEGARQPCERRVPPCSAFSLLRQLWTAAGKHSGQERGMTTIRVAAGQHLSRSRLDNLVHEGPRILSCRDESGSTRSADR
jgi:hypothetical protein